MIKYNVINTDPSLNLDAQFIFDEILRRGGRIVPKMIRQGTKFYTMTVNNGKRCTKTVFKDS